jgi:hypothetical protein
VKRSISQPTNNLGERSACILDQYRFQRFQTQIAIVIIDSLRHSVSKKNTHVATYKGDVVEALVDCKGSSELLLVVPPGGRAELKIAADVAHEDVGGLRSRSNFLRNLARKKPHSKTPRDLLAFGQGKQMAERYIW